MRNLILFIPPEFAVLLIAGAGVALIFGARAVAGTLFLLGLALALLPVLLAPLFDALPTWLLIALLVFFGLGLLRALFNLLIGTNATDHMVGALAADSVRGVLALPFRLLARILRSFLGGR